MDKHELRQIVRESVREELDYFYEKFYELIQEISRQYEQERVSPVMEEIVLMLSTQGEMSADEIAKKRGTSREAIVQICQKLWKLGEIEKVKRGRQIIYRTPDKEE